MLILGLINYAVIGIGWLNGGLQRIFGETFGTKDQAGFVHALDVGKVIFVAYAAVVAIAGFGIFVSPGRAQVSLGVAIVAGFFLVVLYETAIERLALTAAGRLAATNMLQFVQVVVYSVSVLLVLRSGGGLLGVFACQLGSVLVVRFLVPLCWQGMRPRYGISGFCC